MIKYAIHWYHKEGPAYRGHGAAGFDRESTEAMVRDLNRQHPTLHHEAKPQLPSFGEWLRGETRMLNGSRA